MRVPARPHSTRSTRAGKARSPAVPASRRSSGRIPTRSAGSSTLSGAMSAMAGPCSICTEWSTSVARSRLIGGSPKTLATFSDTGCSRTSMARTSCCCRRPCATTAVAPPRARATWLLRVATATAMPCCHAVVQMAGRSSSMWMASTSGSPASGSSSRSSAGRLARARASARRRCPTGDRSAGISDRQSPSPTAWASVMTCSSSSLLRAMRSGTAMFSQTVKPG